MSSRTPNSSSSKNPSKWTQEDAANKSYPKLKRRNRKQPLVAPPVFQPAPKRN